MYIVAGFMKFLDTEEVADVYKSIFFLRNVGDYIKKYTALEWK